MNIKPLIKLILVILVVFLYAGCNAKKLSKSEKYQRYLLNNYLLLLLNQDNYSLVDNFDGTTGFNVTDGFGNAKKRYFKFKKCLQGQVYRSAENDCRGAGNAGNWWNASLLQYCISNNNACDDNFHGLVGPDSQLYLSCDTDSTISLKWMVIPPRNLTRLMATAEFAAIYKDFPMSDAKGVWLSQSSDTDSSLAYFSSWPYSQNVSLKTSLKYALCEWKY